MRLSDIYEDGHWVLAKNGKYTSPLINPGDRERFIKWGKPKRRKKIQEARNNRPLYNAIFALRPQMAMAAQAIYDEWDDEGGICDQIAEELGGIISQNMEVEISEYGHDGDDHAAIIVSNGTERYLVDIPFQLYETGGGYNWVKINGVRFTPDNIVIEPIY